MSTTPVESWAVDINTLGPVYPFVGNEMLMVIVCLIVWVGFHIIQIMQENAEINREVQELNSPERLEEALKLTNGHH